MTYTIQVKNRTGEKGTIIPDVGFHYAESLNDLNEGELKLSGTGVIKRGLLQTGSEVEIYKNGTLDFLGVIDMIDKLDGGTISAHISGFEFWLGKENGNYNNSPYTNTASATIFSQIIAESNYWNAGSIATGFNTDYRLNDSQSLWSAIRDLSNKTQQDIERNYATKQISISNHIGSPTSIGIYNDGIQIRNMRNSEGYPAGNNIIVLGKGDGNAQIRGSASDATSITAFGKITRSVIDRSVGTTSEANKLADAELAISKDPTQIFDFEFVNPYENVKLGDVITINSTDKDVINQDVRIVAIEKGEIDGKEVLSVQVTNPEYRNSIKTRNKILSGFVKKDIDNNSYMQGSGNTLHFNAGINAKSGSPHRNIFYIPEKFIKDQFNNIRVEDFGISFDITGFRSDAGTATELGVAPAFNSSVSSAANHNHGVQESGTHLHGVPSHNTISAGGASYVNTSLIVSGTINITSSSWHSIGTFSLSSNSAGFHCHISFVGAYSYGGSLETREMLFRISRPFNTYPRSDGILVHYVNTNGSRPNGSCHIFVPDSSAATYTIQASLNGSSANFNFDTTCYSIATHSHGVNSFNANSNSIAVSELGRTPAVSGATDSHDHGVSISSDLTESVSVNATDLGMRLDYWNGTAWVEKHNFGNQGTLKGEFIDLSVNGTYPDAHGFWRVRLDPNSVSPDFVYSNVEIKHNLEN